MWLSDERQSAKLFDAVLPEKSPESGREMLDFYLGVADAAAEGAPRQAKRFLDRSFDLVDDNDPSMFFKTSDGSVDEFFAYGKADISWLYTRIGEYRLSALTNDRVSQFDEGAVSAYLTILNSEIRRSERYDASVLSAVFGSMRLPRFRPM